MKVIIKYHFTADRKYSLLLVRIMGKNILLIEMYIATAFFFFFGGGRGISCYFNLKIHILIPGNATPVNLSQGN